MQTSPRFFRFPLALVASAMLLACGGGGDGGTTPTPIPAGFTVSLSSSTLSVEQGAAGTVTATIGRTGGHTTTIDLTIEGLPAGVTASFNPAAITASTTSTTLSVTVAASVAPGSYPFTIRGTAGADTKTASVTLTVTAKPAIAISLSATAGSLPQGGNSTYTATVARTNFAAAVAVAVTGAPAGVTATVTNAGDVYTVALAVGGNAAAGTYPLATTASGTGVTSVTATFTLTVTVAPASITLAASPTALSVQASGAAQSSTITITRINFAGTVVTAVQSGLPAGATATFNPAGPTSASSVTATFAADVSTVPGTYNVVLQGAGNQANPGTVTIALTVTAPPTTIALSATPSSLTVQQGAAGQTTINIARTNFPGAVTLSASGHPAGVTPTFTVSPTVANSAVLGLAVAGSVATGTYVITIIGSASGISNATTTVSLTVTQASSGSNISYTFCPANGIPIWFAAQSGTSGPWVPVTIGANNTFSTTISGGVGGVAYVMQGGSSFTLTISYGTTAELAAGGTSLCSSPTLARKTVTGTVTGFGTGNADFVSVSFGSASASPPPSFAIPGFTITGALDGLRDLLGTRSTFNISNPMNPLTVNKIFLKRGLNPPNLGTVGTVDFNGVDAFDPDTKQITINGLIGGENQVGVFNAFTTANQSLASLSSIFLSSGNVVNITTVPSAKTIAGDVQNIYAFASTGASPTVQEIRAVSSFFRDPSNQTITLGPPLFATTVSAAATAPYARLRTQVGTQSQYMNLWMTSFSQTGRSASITMTAGYLGAAATFDTTIPDFTGVGTWQATWGIQPAITTSWFASAIGFLTASGASDDGTMYRIAQRTGQITP